MNRVQLLVLVFVTLTVIGHSDGYGYVRRCGMLDPYCDAGPCRNRVGKYRKCWRYNLDQCRCRASRHAFFQHYDHDADDYDWENPPMHLGSLYRWYK